MSNLGETLASAGISAGAGLLGSAIGSIGGIFSNRTNLKIARETNAMNYKIAQEANEANYKLWQAQNQANIDMWNMENEYNTATNQRKRLEDAGLNPYLMMSGGNAGTAGSISSASASPYVSPTMQAATVQNPVVTTPFDQAMQNVSDMLYNRSLQNEQIRSQQLENDIKEIDLQFKPLEKLYEKNSKRFQSQLDQLSFEFARDTFKDRVRNVGLRNDIDYQDSLLREQQVISAQLSNEAQRYINFFVPANQIAGLMQTVAQIQATETSIKKMYADIRLTVATATGKEKENYIVNQITDGLINAIKAKNQYEYELYTDKVDGANKATMELLGLKKGLNLTDKDIILRNKEISRPESYDTQIGLGPAKITQSRERRYSPYLQEWLDSKSNPGFMFGD